MSRYSWALAASALAIGSSAAQDGERFVERTPLPHRPIENTQQRAGNPAAVARWAVPGVSPHETGGYVGGQRLSHNSALSKGYGAATGPTQTGTFGWDFAGFAMRPGRVFLRESADPSRGKSIARAYRTDGPRVPDPVAARPLRRALLEAQEDREEASGEGE